MGRHLYVDSIVGTSATRCQMANGMTIIDDIYIRNVRWQTEWQ